MAAVPRIAAGAAVLALAAGGVVAGSTVADVTPEASVEWVGPGTASLEEGQYVGPCAIVTPPAADPCQAAQLVLRYQFFGELVNAAYHREWATKNKPDAARLASLMAAPRCSTFTDPQPQIMRTFYGAALADAVEAYACALGTEAIVMPPPHPPVTGSDKSAPTPPGPLQVQPETGPSA